MKIAVMDKKIVGYCISVKRLHNYEGVVIDVTWNSAYIWEPIELKVNLLSLKTLSPSSR
jgi:hypothetical protein